MAGLGLGLGISSGVNGPGHSSGVVSDFLYLLAQNGDVLQAQRDRGDPASPALILFEPNDVESDSAISPRDLLLAQNGDIIQTEDGRPLAVEERDLPYARFITQDREIILTQDDNFLVAQEVQPDSTIQEFITQDGRFLFTQSGDQLTTT